MMQQQHGGFFASVPRIVRTQYKDLSASEKWLYTCLKDLCGDRGTCFRNLRTLSIETSLSTGSLSTMIPNLHKAGLIHAEKKPRGLGGKEVWHISIVDIWQSNAVYCSGIEQPGISIVQGLNNQVPVVQNMNEEAEYCSNSEPSCSNFDDRRRLLEEEKIEEDIPLRTEEQITEPFLVPTLSLRDDVSVHTSSYSHEPAESEWLCEIGGETDIFSKDDPDETVKRPVVQGGNLAPGEGRAPLESEERREGSNEHPAVKPPSPGPPPASPGRAAQLREQPTGQYNPHEKPRQATRMPTDLSSEASKPPLPDKTEGKGNRKKDTPLLCEPSTVRKLIDVNRGYVLKEKGAIIHQNIVLREWSEQNPLEHYHEVMNHLKTCRCKNPSHEWWHKDEHWRYLDADNLAKLTPGVLSELGLVPKPELPPDIPIPAASSSPNGKYHAYTRASMYEPIEIGV
jgi:hypothetical protein